MVPQDLAIQPVSVGFGVAGLEAYDCAPRAFGVSNDSGNLSSSQTKTPNEHRNPSTTSSVAHMV